MHIRKNKGKHIMHFKTWRCGYEQFGTIGKLKILPHNQKKIQNKIRLQIIYVEGNCVVHLLCHALGGERSDKVEGRVLALPVLDRILGILLNAQHQTHTVTRNELCSTCCGISYQFQLCPVSDYRHFCYWQNTDSSNFAQSETTHTVVPGIILTPPAKLTAK